MFPESGYCRCLFSAILCSVLYTTGCAVANQESTTVSVQKAQPTKVTNNYILDTASLDLDHDGCIGGKAEMDAFKQHVTSALAGAPNSVLRAHSIVYRSDVNRDGKICWCDFISIYLHDKNKRNKHSVPFLVLPDTVMFSQLDTDGDGLLKGEEKEKLQKEFASCLPYSQAQFIIDSMANLLDQDDSISREEFQAFFDNPEEGLHKQRIRTDNKEKAP